VRRFEPDIYCTTAAHSGGSIGAGAALSFSLGSKSCCALGCAARERQRTRIKPASTGGPTTDGVRAKPREATIRESILEVLASATEL